MLPVRKGDQVLWEEDLNRELPTPKPDDMLYYVTGVDRHQRVRVIAWTYKDLHDTLQLELDDRRTYKFCMQEPYKKGLPNPLRKVWEGANLDDPMLSYLANQYSPKMGYTAFWYIKQPGGWLSCEDPRSSEQKKDPLARPDRDTVPVDYYRSRFPGRHRSYR